MNVVGNSVSVGDDAFDDHEVGLLTCSACYPLIHVRACLSPRWTWKENLLCPCGHRLWQSPRTARGYRLR